MRHWQMMAGRMTTHQQNSRKDIVVLEEGFTEENPDRNGWNPCSGQSLRY